jgi:hypothetical protein
MPAALAISCGVITQRSLLCGLTNEQDRGPELLFGQEIPEGWHIAQAITDDPEELAVRS